MAAGRPASRATPRDTPTPWSRPRMCPEGDGSLLEITRRGERGRNRRAPERKRRRKTSRVGSRWCVRQSVPAPADRRATGAGFRPAERDARPGGRCAGLGPERGAALEPAVVHVVPLRARRARGVGFPGASPDVVGRAPRGRRVRGRPRAPRSRPPRAALVLLPPAPRGGGPRLPPRVVRAVRAGGGPHDRRPGARAPARMAP